MEQPPTPPPTDMSLFEAQFKDHELSERMDDLSFERVATLRDRIADLQEILGFRKEQVAHAQEMAADLEIIERQIKEYLAAILAQKRPFDKEVRSLRSNMRDDQRELDRLQREWARLQAELAAQEALRRERLEILHSTRNAPWRIGVDGDKARPHQLVGAMRMVAAGRGIMGDSMGLGKTLQSIMAVNMLREKGEARKVLIFTLKPVLRDFEREFHKWYPGQFVHVLDHSKRGIKNVVLDLVQHMEECIVLTNYEVWRKDRKIIDQLIRCGFDTMILDEAHVFKGKDTNTFRGIQEIVYAENRCNQCGAQVFADSKKKFDGYEIPRTACPKCNYYPTKFEEFRSVKKVFPMTGTPILNKPHDIFPMLNLVDVKGFPEEQRFLEDYCIQKCVGCGGGLYMCECRHEDGTKMGARYRWFFRDGGPDRLLKSLGMKFTSRTRDSAGVEMPPQEVKHHYLELDDERYPRYSQFTRDLKEKAKVAFSDGSSLTETETLSWYTRVRQAATWPDGITIRDMRKDEMGALIGTGEIIWPRTKEDLPGESIIMDWGENLTLEAVESGQRVVIASNFKQALIEMEKRLLEKGIRAARFDGDTPKTKRQGIIDDFNAKYTQHGKHQYDVILVNYKTGSTGLNLSGAQEIVVLDREWNDGKEQQMLDRVRRLDSKFSSTVHILHCSETATDLMDAIIDEKKAMLQDFDRVVSLQEAMRKFLNEDGV